MIIQKNFNRFLRLVLTFFMVLGLDNFSVYAQTSEYEHFKPYFASLKRSETYLRNGPSRDQFISWTYKKKGIPVEVIATYGEFRKVRDFDETEGWIANIMLSSRRSVITLDGKHNLYKNKDKSSKIIAYIEGNVILTPQECDYFFCLVTHNNIEGWIEKENIFGVYEDETF